MNKLAAAGLVILILLLPDLAFCQASPIPVRVAADPVQFSLDELERRTFKYFWDLVDPATGQIPDRYPRRTFASIAATGFGLAAYPVGVEGGHVSRLEAAQRALLTLRFFSGSRQGDAAQGVTGYRGFYYHFLEYGSGVRYKKVELSTIDTALLLAGMLCVQSYFDRDDPLELEIRTLVDQLVDRVEWDWVLQPSGLVTMGWKPESGFLRPSWKGYNEAMILYLLALGSETHPIPASSWDKWTETYQWADYHGYEHVNFAPLFGHQYSQMFVDFRGIQDAYMKGKGIDYFENSRRATYSQQAYAVANPGGFTGYSDVCWGLTACDGPASTRGSVQGRDVSFRTYWARGTSAFVTHDDGTIAPTAAGGSLPFAPEICLPALEHLWTDHGHSLVGTYGFKDAFNLTFPGDTPGDASARGWFDRDYLGIDQGAILLQLANYRSGLIWGLLRKNPHIQRGLKRAGFRGGWMDAHAGALPRARAARHLWVVSERSLKDPGLQTMVSSLQGLTAKSQERQIFITGRRPSPWLEHLVAKYGVTQERIEDPWELLAKCQSMLRGYVLYDSNHPGSLNAATTLGGPLNALLVDTGLEARVRGAGITNLLYDVRGHDAAWARETVRDRLNPGLVLELKESLRIPLRDYAVMADAPVFYSEVPATRDAWLKPLPPDALYLGWGDASRGEDQFIGPNSKAGVFSVPADHARNLSVLSGIRETDLQQTQGPLPADQGQMHHVCFLITDGDNLQYNLGGFPRYFQHPARGTFSMGWALSPSLVELAPSVMRWYYDQAVPGKDYFVTGPSGGGYFYPSRYPRTALLAHLKRLNQWLEKGDMNIVQVLDFNAFDRLDLWDLYTAQPNLDAVFYLDYSRYNRPQGALQWSHGKPVVAARELLWQGLKNADPNSVTRRLNQAVRDSSKPEGYSLVMVHVWSHGLGSVEKVVGGLDPHVQVVTPDVFVKRIVKNLRPSPDGDR